MAGNAILILKACLNTENVRHILNTTAPDSLCPEEVDLLQQLTLFFAPQTDLRVNRTARDQTSSPTSGASSSDSKGSPTSVPSATESPPPSYLSRSPSAPAGRGRKRAASASLSDSGDEPKPKKWAMSRLAVISDIPKEVRDLVARSRDDISKFMDDQHDQTKFATLEDIANEGETEELMLELMSYAQKVEDRPGIDRVRCVFVWLLIYDFVQELNGRLGRSESGRRVGGEIRQQITDCLPTGFFDTAYEKGPNSKTNEQLIQDYARRGLKINQLCQEFGEGCLFYLAPRLTANFLAREYRQREDSEVHIAVFREMREAGLVGAAADFNEDGRRIRGHLISLLRTALDSRRSARPE